MIKIHKLLISGIGAIVLIGFALGVLGFLNGLQNTRENFSLPDETVSAFQEELTGRALARGLRPIEGFNAFLLLRSFPGLIEADFDGVQTGIMREEGVYFYTNSELQWNRTSYASITSGEKTITREGYGMLLENLLERLDIPAPNAEEAVSVIDAIDIPADLAEHIASKRDLIVVHDPQPLSVITSPFTARGEARGSWFFEADFQLTLVDWDGRIIAESYAIARDNPEADASRRNGAGWMTEEFVPFKGMIEFELSEENRVYDRGTLIFQKANPSGLSERDDALEIPVLFER